MKILTVKTVCGWGVAAMTLASCADVASTRYIRAGLVGQYDGIDNAGVGVHSSSATNWVDLSGNGNDGAFNTANISWVANGWTYTRASTLNSIKPVTLTAAIGSVINSRKFTVESTVNTTYVTGKNPGTRCGLFGNYSGSSGGFSFELTANKELRYYLEASAPSVVSSLKLAAGENATAAVQTENGSNPVFWKNGTSSAGSGSTSSKTKTLSSAPVIGGEVNTGRDMTFRGTYYSCRIYNRVLSADEMKINAAIDQVRFFGTPIATANASFMPNGWSLTDDGLLAHVDPSESFAWTPSTIIEPEELEMSAPAVDLNLSGFTLGVPAHTFEGALTIDGQVRVTVPAMLEGGTYTLVAARSITLGTNGRVELAPECVTGIGGTRRLEVTNTGILLHVTTELTTLGSDLYIKYGLVLHYDGIDNQGTGTQDPTATTWKDLSGHGHDAELMSTGRWVATGRFNDQPGRLGWIDRVWGDLAASMNYTVDIAAVPSSVAARFCYVGNYIIYSNEMTVENVAGTGQLRWWNCNNPNWYPNVYVAADEAAALSLTVAHDRYRMFKGGVMGGEVVKEAPAISTKGEHAALGGDNARDEMAFLGTYQALRLYNRPLSKEEVAVNAAIDRVRYGGTTASLADLLPAGWTLEPNNRFLRTYSGEETIERASVVDGDVRIAANTTLTLAPMHAFYKQLVVTGQVTVEGPVTLVLSEARNLLSGDYVLIESGAVTCAEGAAFTLAADTPWADGTTGELLTSEKGLVLRVFASAVTLWNGTTQRARYWNPETDDHAWSTTNNWADGAYDGPRDLMPGYDTNATLAVYCTFMRPDTVRFTQFETWTHAKTYFSIQSGLSAPVVFEADDPAYGLDMSVQKTTAFALARGPDSSGWLKIRGGTFACTSINLPSAANESPRARVRFDFEGGTLRADTDFHIGYSNDVYSDVTISGGTITVGNDFNSNLKQGCVTSFTLANDATLEVKRNFQLSNAAISTFVGRQTGGTCRIGGVANFVGDQPAEASYTLEGGKFIVRDIQRHSTVQKFVLAGGALVPPENSEAWLASANFLTVASGAAARLDTEDKTVTLKALVTDEAGGTNFSFTKEGAGTLKLGTDTLANVGGTLTVAKGALNFQDAEVKAYTMGTLKLVGGARLALDVTDAGADCLMPGTVAFENATTLNPFTIEIAYTGIFQLGAGESRTLIASGVTEADLAKLMLAGSADQLAVEGGALVLKPSSRQKVDVEWTGAAGDGGRWSTAGNWQGGTLPQGGDTAIINQAAGGTTQFDLGGVLFDSLVFGSAAGAFTQQGEDVLMVVRSITNLSENVQTFEIPTRLGVAGAPFEANVAGDVVFTNDVSFAGSAFTKKGAGTLVVPEKILASPETVVVEAGTLKLTDAGGMAGTTSTEGEIRLASGARLDLNQGAESVGARGTGGSTLNKTIYVAGAGPDGEGAIYNSQETPTGAAGSLVSRMVLTGDTTVGGGAVSSCGAAGAGSSITGGDFVLTTKNRASDTEGYLFKTTVFDLARLNVEGVAVWEGAQTGTIAGGIHAFDASALRFKSATLPETMPLSLEPGAAVSVRHEGTVVVDGSLTIGEGGVMTVRGSGDFKFTGAVTNAGTIVLGETGGLIFTGPELQGGTYQSDAHHLWFSGAINSPESDITLRGGASSSFMLGLGNEGEGLPVFRSVTAESAKDVWVIAGTNVVMDGVWTSLMDASGRGRGAVRLNNTVASSTTTVENVTWNVNDLLVGWKNVRYGHVIVGSNTTINVAGVMETAADGENALATSVVLKEGATLNCTSSNAGDLRFARYLSDGNSAGGLGTGQIHSFTIDGGTYLSPNAATQFGRGSDYFYTFLKGGLMDVKGMQVRTLDPWRDNLHGEGVIQTGGELRVGSAGMTSCYPQWEHPHADLANGRLTATDSFRTDWGRSLGAFGASRVAAGAYTIDLNGKDLTWNSPLLGSSDVTLTGAGSFTANPLFQGIPTGKWTLEADADLSGAAGFAGGLELKDSVSATIHMGGTNLVEFGTFNKQDFVYTSASYDAAAITKYVGTLPYYTTTFAQLHKTFTSGERPMGDYMLLVYRGEFYVPAEKVGIWHFAGTYDDRLYLVVDGTTVVSTSSATGVGVGSCTLAEGWHTFLVAAHDMTGNQGPMADSWKAAKMALGYVVSDSEEVVSDPAALTRFDEETIAFRPPSERKYRSGVRFRTLGAVSNVETYQNDDQIFRGFDSVTNSLVFNPSSGCAALKSTNARFDGYFYVPKENEGGWSFTGQFDDRIALTIDGEKVFETSSWTVAGSRAVTLSVGWHAFTVCTYEGGGGYGGVTKDDNGVTCALKVLPADGEKTLAFSVDNFRIASSLLEAQKWEATGLSGETKLGTGATLTNAASAGACPINGTLAGSGALAGAFRFAGTNNAWRVEGDAAKLTACVKTEGVTNDDFLQELTAVEAVFATKATAKSYVLAAAGTLTAEEAAAVTVSARDAKGIQEGWTATVEGDRFVIVNPHPSGLAVILR